MRAARGACRSATTCVTGAPVSLPIRCGRSERIHFELWPGSVETITSSWRRGSQVSATASIGLASPQMPSASIAGLAPGGERLVEPPADGLAAGEARALPRHQERHVDRPLARARFQIAATRSVDEAVTLATTRTCAAMCGSFERVLNRLYSSPHEGGVRVGQKPRTASSTTSAVASPAASVSPGSAWRRTSASAIGPWTGETTGARDAPDLLLAELQRGARLDRRAEPQAAQVAVRLAAVEEPRDGLLADVAALGEGDGALVEAGLLGDHAVVEVDAVAGAAVLDADDLRGGLADLDGARGDQRAAHALGALGVAEDVDADVGGHEHDRDARRSRARTLSCSSGPRPVGAGDPARVGADQRQLAHLDRALVQLDVAARACSAGSC